MRPWNILKKYIFPNRTIISTCTIKRLPRSPDLAPLDFLDGPMSKTIYKQQHQRIKNLYELRTKIIQSFQNLAPEMLRNTRRSCNARLGYCLVQAGSQFQDKWINTGGFVFIRKYKRTFNDGLVKREAIFVGAFFLYSYFFSKHNSFL